MITQYGVLPYRIDAAAKLEILLITSKERRRWVIPKGNPIPFFLNYETAAREAFEEAGVEGRIATMPIGAFRYAKRRASGPAPAIVNVYPLLVTRQAAAWPERGQRELRWFSPEEAAAAVEEPELAVIIMSFSGGKEAINPRASLAVMGVNRFSWGYRMLRFVRAIMPKEDRFFDMFERHAQILVAGADALAKMLDGGKEAINPRASLAVMGVNRFSWGYRMLRFIRAIMPKEDRFFDMFERHAQILVAGADALAKMLDGGENIAESCKQIATHENAADHVTRDVLVAVRRSFITPFDRSAITALTSSMDNAIDEMWQTAKAITLYEVTAFQPQMKEMATIAAEASRLIAEAVPLMRNTGRNAARLHQLTEQVVHLEGRADDLYDSGLKALFASHGKDRAMSFFVGREVYSHLEKVLDRFEDVADEIEGIVIDHA